MIYRYQRTISYRLIAWALLNIVTGLWLGRFLTLPPTSLSFKDFTQGLAVQCLAWGVIDLIIGGIGLRGSRAKIHKLADAGQIQIETRRLRRLLWINSALDGLYILAGILLLLTLGHSDPFSRGNAVGVILQGCFLLAFDLLHAFQIPTECKLPGLPHFETAAHQPYDFPGTRGTVLLVHGFPGTPVEVLHLGQAIQAQGWRAVGMLLPGFGTQFENLFQQRATGWADAIAAEVARLRSQGPHPVILLGFSLGAGLSISAATQIRPDALILIAPFWVDIPAGLAWLREPLGALLPESFRPFRIVAVDRLEASSLLVTPPGQLYPKPSSFFRQLEGMRVPVVFLEQFLELSQLVLRNAPKITCPTCILQGDRDPIVNPRATRHLSRLLTCPHELVEIPGEHHITVPASPAFPRVVAEVTRYLDALTSMG